MKILVTGVNGQLGFDVCRELDRRDIPYIAAGRSEFDITDAEAVNEYIRRTKPEAVLHCAAFTAVDKAEEAFDIAFAVNAEGTRNIALACRNVSAKMMYISTDYVFPGDGERFYEPEDPTGPLGAYGRTKLEGEEAVQDILERYFIVRISWVFGLNGHNFVKTMLRLAETKTELNVVGDQVGSPTYTADLAPLLCDMIMTDKYGIYHATNEGICSWADFAQEIFRLAGKHVIVHSIPTSEYPTPAKRPLNSRMSKDKIERNGFGRLPSWQDALTRYLKELNVIA